MKRTDSGRNSGSCESKIREDRTAVRHGEPSLCGTAVTRRSCKDQACPGPDRGLRPVLEPRLPDSVPCQLMQRVFQPTSGLLHEMEDVAWVLRTRPVGGHRLRAGAGARATPALRAVRRSESAMADFYRGGKRVRGTASGVARPIEELQRESFEMAAKVGVHGEERQLPSAFIGSTAAARGGAGTRRRAPRPAEAAGHDREGCRVESPRRRRAARERR